LLRNRRTSGDPLLCALAHKHQCGSPGTAHAREILAAPGLTISDVVCTSGPDDVSFEERHPGVSIAIVLRGTFSYAGDRGRALLTSGALLLGEAERPFRCSHEHGEGDRCIAFHFEPGFFERVAGDAGARSLRLRTHRLPPMRATAGLVARGAIALERSASTVEWQELACELAAAAVCANGDARPVDIPARDERRAAEIARLLESTYHRPHSIVDLAHRAGISPFQLVRTFKRVTGTTPHQFILRMRLRAAARLLRTTALPVTEIAYAVGFEDLSNFIHSFRAEFGMSPSAYRRSAAGT
jgi:AraC family transcriptional regulator